MKRILLCLILFSAACQNDPTPSNNGSTVADMGPSCGENTIECDICESERAVCNEELSSWVCEKDSEIIPPDSCKEPCEDDPNFLTIGESCGCAGELTCVDEVVSCIDTIELNVCGGCVALTETLDESCGECGTNICDGLDAIQCEDPGFNVCGGCEIIEENIGDSCGPAPENSWVCEDLNTLKCIKSLGDLCTVDNDCFSENCSFGTCAPKGYSHVKAATFTMGAPLDEMGLHADRENGQHEVTLTRDLYVKQTTVTQGEYETLTGANPSYFINCGPDCPVERINFYEMLKYANSLSLSEGLDACYNLTNCSDDEYNLGCLPTTRDGLLCSNNNYVCDDDTLSAALDCNGYRLPTESEWEYFARAGTTSAFITPSGTILSFYYTPLSPELDAIAWYFANSKVSYEGGLNCLIPNARIDCSDLPETESIGPHPVAQKDPNLWGLYDMTGNIWERVWDISGDYPDPGTSVIDPTGPAILDAEDSRVRRMRGGPFDAYGQYMRVAYRTGPAARTRIYNTGFRLVRSVPQN